MRKFIVKLLTLQCTVVKGSALSFIVLIFAPILFPIYLLVTAGEWIEKKSNANKTAKNIVKVFNTKIPIPGSSVIEEAGQACDMNISKYERFLGLR